MSVSPQFNFSDNVFLKNGFMWSPGDVGSIFNHSQFSMYKMHQANKIHSSECEVLEMLEASSTILSSEYIRCTRQIS